ncbi:uncharacterized protein LOC124712496 isoform X1 [Schistocerca piceifrons]|uniref:uncharacterized protein LOC124712496 isoform X1 n=1 Tax=Schistocerca piceifrons TaxID=274613 RepID=UPI001F5F8BDE|nr:uncharacterized protein LOC124712496 isoform X1 [Schistocerca piceifrons]
MGIQRWLLLALVAVAAVGARPAEDAAEEPEPPTRTARAQYGSLKSQPPPWGFLYAPQQFRAQQPVAIPTVIHRIPSVYQPQLALQPTRAAQSFQWNPPRDEGYTNLYTIVNGELVTPVRHPVYHVPLTTSRLPINRSPFSHFPSTIYSQHENDGPLKQLSESSAIQKSSAYWGSVQSEVPLASGGIFTPFNEARYDYTKAQSPPHRVGNFGVLGKHGFGNIFQKSKPLEAIARNSDVPTNSDYVASGGPSPSKGSDAERNLNEKSFTNQSSEIELKLEKTSNKSDTSTDVSHPMDQGLVPQTEKLPDDSKEVTNQKQPALLGPALSKLREILDRRPEWNDSQDLMDWRKNYTDPNRPPGTTTLILKPEAEAVAGCNGTAIANPISHAVVPIGQPVDVHFEPRAVAVAGPGGKAKAHSDLVLSFVAAAVSEESDEDVTTSSPN